MELLPRMCGFDPWHCLVKEVWDIYNFGVMGFLCGPFPVTAGPLSGFAGLIVCVFVFLSSAMTSCRSSSSAGTLG